jgi:threonyl-tRNA synthetase
LTDFAMLYRDERPGELSGLARVRSFSQDDCHIFCREDQVDAEIDRALQMTVRIMQTFGFSYRYRLSTRDLDHPEKYIGDLATWDRVEKWAVEIMERNNIEYYDGPGEAAFYAPKMDLMATDALGREWQLSTVQIDYSMPERFNLAYIDSDGQEKRPVMLHRAILGSAERMMMILIEHYAGAFPTWLAPVQVKVLPIADRHHDYAQTVVQSLSAEGIRVEIDDRSERLQAKIRDAQLQKIPYMLILGDTEAKDQTVAVRKRSGGNQEVISLKDFANKIVGEMKTRSRE